MANRKTKSKVATPQAERYAAPVDRVVRQDRYDIRDELACELAEMIVLGLLEFGDLTPAAYADKDGVQLYIEDMIRDRLLVLERRNMFVVTNGNRLRSGDGNQNHDTVRSTRVPAGHDKGNRSDNVQAGSSPANRS